jgi:uncharacterized protein (TIGR02001 family)
MTMKKILAGLGVFGLAMGATVPAVASDVKWTGTLAVTSDYKFRGISQSDNDPAVQGSIEAGYKGFMAGVWASSIDFATDPGADVEIDLYAGYTHAFNDTTSLTGKVVYYWYPGADTTDADYVELIAALEHNFGKFSANLQVAYTPDYFGGADSATWLGGGVEVPISDWLTASGNVGYQWFDDNAFVGINDYTHGDIGVTATWEIFALDLRYVMTDVDDVDCFAGGDICDNKFVVTLSLTKGSDE